MNFKEYQEKSKETADYPEIGYKWVYPCMGLSGETGEVLEKLKKIIRNKEGKIDEEDKSKIEKELGDVLWYLSMLATELDLDLDKIAERNIKKLLSRKERGVIKSEGDER